MPLRNCLPHRNNRNEVELNNCHLIFPLSRQCFQVNKLMASSPSLRGSFSSSFPDPVFCLVLACQLCLPLVPSSHCLFRGSDPRVDWRLRRQGQGGAYLGPRVPGDEALQHEGVPLPDGVDTLTDVVLLHHTRLACMDNLSLGGSWKWGEGTGLGKRRQGQRGWSKAPASEYVSGRRQSRLPQVIPQRPDLLSSRKDTPRATGQNQKGQGLSKRPVPPQPSLLARDLGCQ